MSYILDALRRAESERQRGQVPGLGAAPLPVSPTAAATGSRGLRWTVLGLLLLAVAGAMLWWLQRPPALPAPAEPAARPLPPAVLQHPPLAVQTAPAPAVAPAQAVPAPLPRVVSAPPPAAAPPTPAQVAAGPSAPADPAAGTRPLRLVELSPQQRSEWPAPSIGGSVWSDSAPSRFVILNGQVMREGQTVSPGLVLERIQPRSALLRWRGLLVEVPL